MMKNIISVRNQSKADKHEVLDKKTQRKFENLMHFKGINWFLFKNFRIIVKNTQYVIKWD